MNIELIKQVLIVGIASGIVSTGIVQKIKEGFKFKSSKKIILLSFITSMIVGPLFSLSFTDLTIINSLWVGIVTFLGADTIYKAFEDKIFKSFSSLDNAITIERTDEE